MSDEEKIDADAEADPDGACRSDMSALLKALEFSGNGLSTVARICRTALRLLDARVSRGEEQIKEIGRLVWLADHGGTTEQIRARAELRRLGLRRRPMLTEDEARALIESSDAAFYGPRGDLISIDDAARLIAAASRGETHRPKPCGS